MVRALLPEWRWRCTDLSGRPLGGSGLRQRCRVVGVTLRWVPLEIRRLPPSVSLRFVSTSPELHKRLTIEAAERNLSLNQWAIHKLAERQPV
jgi:hypothetical protein